MADWGVHSPRLAFARRPDGARSRVGRGYPSETFSRPGPGHLRRVDRARAGADSEKDRECLLLPRREVRVRHRAGRGDERLPAHGPAVRPTPRDRFRCCLVPGPGVRRRRGPSRPCVPGVRCGHALRTVPGLVPDGDGHAHRAGPYLCEIARARKEWFSPHLIDPPQRRERDRALPVPDSVPGTERDGSEGFVRGSSTGCHQGGNPHPSGAAWERSMTTRSPDGRRGGGRDLQGPWADGGTWAGSPGSPPASPENGRGVHHLQ